ncbi:hypothetical protein B7R21_17195 [Subtercola boreus]|uniref:GGDEF domain-containing protein n=1 Tax=Subtercola boreus TaxID=120213 RepID=A0A3E0VBN8_9MICO|nr:diguanylate cyclase [Subtercola boreus]RFA07055.1 hypothetical protein B7R21_17195 [Subtercola boreus]
MSPVDQAEGLFDHAPCGLLSATQGGVVTNVNETFLSMVGATRAEVVGHYLIERLTRGSKLFYETRFMPMLRQQGHASEVAFDFQLSDARYLSVFVNAVVDIDVSDENSGATIRFAVFDATVRRTYERDLLAARRAAEVSERRVRILQTATTGFGSAETEADLGAALSEAAEAATDASRVGVWLLDGTGQLVRTQGSDHVGRIPIDVHGLLVDALRTATTISCGDPADLEARYPHDAADLRARRIQAVTVLPIIDDGTPIGVLACGFGRSRTLEAATLELLESLTEQAVLVRQRMRLRELLSYQSLHDALTGMPNRLSLQRRLDTLLTRETPDREGVALIFIDLDGFKAVNDRLGHRGGDLVLKQVSQRLSEVTRAGDMVGRLGGDEFLLICENVDEVSVLDIAERLRVAVRQPFTGEAADLPLSASVGVSYHRAGREDNTVGSTGSGSADGTSGGVVTGEALIRLADEAMYESKRAGKDRYTFVQV